MLTESSPGSERAWRVLNVPTIATSRNGCAMWVETAVLVVARLLGGRQPVVGQVGQGRTNRHLGPRRGDPPEHPVKTPIADLPAFARPHVAIAPPTADV